jgi:pimeloyl-ACP methyl ester carboxylesterase
MTDTWVLLRGLTREAGHWGSFLDDLARALPEARIVPVDLPGAGSLRAMRCPLSVPAIVDICRECLLERGVLPPYRLLGLSLGGMVVAAWAAAQPHELRGCVLVNSSMRPFSPVTDRLRPRRWPTLLRLLVPGDARRAEQAILRLTSSAPQRHAARVDEWVAIRRARPVGTANGLRQLLAAARYRHVGHAGPGPSVPMLVASGAHDTLVSPRCSLALAAAWNAPHVIHPTAGHDLPLDDGPWLAGRVAAWSRGGAAFAGG